MANREFSSLYCADDKDIFDLLMRKKKEGKALAQHLRALLRSRGIIASPKESPERLVDLISRLPFDWFYLQHLAEFLESHDRRQRTSSCTVTASIEDGGIESVLQDLKKDRGSSQKEAWTIVKEDEGRYRAVVSYTEVQHSLTRLTQRARHELNILVESKDGKIMIRHHSNDKASNIRADIIQRFAPLVQGPPPHVESVDISSCRDCALRTKFFTDLMKAMPDLNVFDVSDVRGNYLESDGDGEPDKADKGLRQFVKRIVLSGSLISTTTEFQDFFGSKKDYYVTHVIWSVDEKISAGGLRVEFEASFSDPEECSNFRYLVRAVQRRDKKTGALLSTRHTPTHEENLRLLRCLESAAHMVCSAIMQEYQAKTSVANA